MSILKSLKMTLSTFIDRYQSSIKLSHLWRRIVNISYWWKWMTSIKKGKRSLMKSKNKGLFPLKYTFSMEISLFSETKLQNIIFWRDNSFLRRFNKWAAKIRSLCNWIRRNFWREGLKSMNLSKKWNHKCFWVILLLKEATSQLLN